MKTASVGYVQKNFARILQNIHAGKEITITRRGNPIAKIVALGPKEKIHWPDFYAEAVPCKGRRTSKIIEEGREDRF